MKKIIIQIVLLCSCLISFAGSADNRVVLSGEGNFLREGDTVSLTVYKYGIVNTEELLQRQYRAVVKQGHFRFSFDSAYYPRYINLTFKANSVYNLQRYAVAPGDRVHLVLQDNKLAITGERCIGFKLQQDIKKIKKEFFKAHKVPHFNAANLERLFFIYDSLASEERQVLNTHEKEIGRPLFTLLSTDLEYSADYYKYYDIYFATKQYHDTADSPVAAAYKKYRSKFKPHMLPTDKIAWHSNFFIKYLVEKAKVEYCFKENSAFDVAQGLADLSRNYSGTLREQVITAMICELLNYPPKVTAAVESSRQYIKNADYQILINRLLKRADGLQAFNFALADTKGTKVRMSDFKGKVVLLDFWFTGCGNCRVQAPILRNVEKKYINAPVKFIGISTDTKRSQWLQSVEGGQYVSPDNINLYTNGLGIKDPVISQYDIKGAPSLVLISKAGRLINVRTDPREDGGKQLSELIDSALAEETLTE